MTEALLSLLAAAAAVAWAVTRRRPEHRPIAFALSAAFLADVARVVLVYFFPPNLDLAAPLRTGSRLLAAYADRALYLVWPAALAGMALRVLAQRPAWPAAAAYVTASAYAIGSYASLRFDALRRFYLAAELVALLIGFAAFLTWLRRAWRKERPDLSVTIAALLVAAHLAAILSGPFTAGLFSAAAWAPMRGAYFVILAVVIVIQGGALWKRSA